jgi:hypothetical protein
MKNMKERSCIAIGLLASLSCSYGWGQSKVFDVDLCVVAAHPEDYNGKFVRVRGTLRSTMETYVIAKIDCAAIPLERPESVSPQPGFSLRRNADLRKLEKMHLANSKQMQCLGPCPTGPYYDPITSTVVGRVDAVSESATEGPVLQRRGFGHNRSSSVRIVVHRYENVQGHKQTESKH